MIPKRPKSNEAKRNPAAIVCIRLLFQPHDTDELRNALQSLHHHFMLDILKELAKSIENRIEIREEHGGPIKNWRSNAYTIHVHANVAAVEDFIERCDILGIRPIAVALADSDDLAKSLTRTWSYWGIDLESPKDYPEIRRFGPLCDGSQDPYM